MSTAKSPIRLSSISALHQYLQLEKPTHPLISVFDFSDINVTSDQIIDSLITDFYIIALKKDCAGGIFKYGQQYYDFQEGVVYFTAPSQVMQFENILLEEVRGFVVAIHPDLFHGYPLANTIENYGYFSYTTNEALFLSEKEENSLMELLVNIKNELALNIDTFTQDLLVSNIELLLKYCDRYYNRQFLTRKKINSDILSKLEALLNDYFTIDSLSQHGVPSVQIIADQLAISPNYLSDMLRVHTGLSTQQHLQNKLVEKAKQLLSTTTMSVSEIAYTLGFEHSQSFHRLFKKVTLLSPLAFRNQFN